MKQPHTHRATAASSPALRRDVGRNSTSKRRRTPALVTFPGESVDHCYRALLETSSSAILLLSPESIILEWNHAAETISGRTAGEVLGCRYVELCLPIEARESFLIELTRVTEGNNVKGRQFPLRVRKGSATMLSWNFTRVLGTHGELIGLMVVGTPVGSHVQEEYLLDYATLRSDARRTQKAVEEERRRIARELHDEFGQALTGLKFDLAWFGRRLAQPLTPTGGGNLLDKVQAMSGSVDALLNSVRSTAASLRPAILDDLGLVPALENLATTFQHRTGAQCEIDVASEVSPIVLPTETATALFRIAQELLTNVMRHASASQVHIRLYQDGDRVTLEVSDNGKGIAHERVTTPDSFGLRGMQERASLLGGYFHIAGIPGVGTTGIVTIPVKESFAQ